MKSLAMLIVNAVVAIARALVPVDPKLRTPPRNDRQHELERQARKDAGLDSSP